MMLAAKELSSEVGASLACVALALPRATYYRRSKAPVNSATVKPRHSPRRLTGEERATVLSTLNSDRFADCSPAQVYATLLDEGLYLCSISTMYRILRAERQVRERRAQLQRPPYAKPELLATAPNQVWSWDITRLHGPVKWSYFQLYVILDIFSRYVVGWLVAPRESEALAVRLIEQTCIKQQIGRDDNDSSIRHSPGYPTHRPLVKALPNPRLYMPPPPNCPPRRWKPCLILTSPLGSLKRTGFPPTYA